MFKISLNKALKISIVFIALILLVALALNYLSGNNPGEENLTRFIEKHYTVTNEELEKFGKYQEGGDGEAYLIYYDLEVAKMGEVLTKKASSVYIGDRILSMRLLQPLLKDFTVKVRDIKPKVVEINKDSLLSYEVTFTLIKNYKKDNKETEEVITKRFYMSKEDDQWKINEFNRFDPEV